MRFAPAVIAVCVLYCLTGSALAAAALTLDVARVAAEAQVRIASQNGLVTVDWPAGDDSRGTATFRLSGDKPLIESLVAPCHGRRLATRHRPRPGAVHGDHGWHAEPGYAGWLDNLLRSGRSATLSALCRRAQVGRRPRHGRGFTRFHCLRHAHGRAVLGRTGFQLLRGQPLDSGRGGRQHAGRSPRDHLRRRTRGGSRNGPAFCLVRLRRYRKVARRCAGGRCWPTRCTLPHAGRRNGRGGAVAVFPPPHRFFYPLDFAENFGFNWFGRDYPSAPGGDGWGVRQPPEGDRRFTPWVNAPPGTSQRLGVFYLLSADGASAALAAARGYTHADRYVPLAGYKTFTSHYHIEHTLNLLKQQAAASSTEIPAALRSPGFVRVFRTAGVDIVHLAEFHNSATPKLAADERLRQLRALHAECGRLSDDNFLLLPGEEPNVHLGGHWISLFPRPVLWVLNRPDGTPLEQQNAAGDSVYHVGQRRGRAGLDGARAGFDVDRPSTNQSVGWLSRPIPRPAVFQVAAISRRGLEGHAGRLFAR